jgi:hypothetical protein
MKAMNDIERNGNVVDDIVDTILSFMDGNFSLAGVFSILPAVITMLPNVGEQIQNANVLDALNLINVSEFLTTLANISYISGSQWMTDNILDVVMDDGEVCVIAVIQLILDQFEGELPLAPGDLDEIGQVLWLANKFTGAGLTIDNLDEISISGYVWRGTQFYGYLGATRVQTNAGTASKNPDTGVVTDTRLAPGGVGAGLVITTADGKVIDFAISLNITRQSPTERNAFRNQTGGSAVDNKFFTVNPNGTVVAKTPDATWTLLESVDAQTLEGGLLHILGDIFNMFFEVDMFNQD